MRRFAPASLFALAACVTPLRDERATATCVLGALIKSGWATDVQVHAPETAEWSVTSRKRDGASREIAGMVKVNHDIIDGRGLYFVPGEDVEVRALLRACPGAADLGDEIQNTHPSELR